MLKNLTIILFLLFGTIAGAQTYIQSPNLIEVPASTVTAAGTTTLTNTSQTIQVFTGTTTQTVVLPNATSLQIGRRFSFSNESSGALTVKFSGGATAVVVGPASGGTSSTATFRVLGNGTSAGTWDIVSGSGGGSGSVTSVALTVPSLLSVSGSPITSSGTFALSYSGTPLPFANGGTGQTNAASAFNAFFEQVATSVGDLVYGGSSGIPTRLAGNTTTTKQFLTQTGTGSASQAPAWGTIASSDVPTLNQNTTGTAANVTGTVLPANGGTGLTSITAHSVMIGEGTGNVAVATPGTSGYVLTSNGSSSDPTWQASSGGGGGASNTVEFLTNTNFEGNTTSGYTASGGTLSVVASGSTGFLFGNYSASWLASASAQTVKSAAFTIYGMANGNCAAQIQYTYAGASGDYTLSVYNGTSTISTVSLLAATSAATPATLYFPCGTSTSSTVQFVLTSTVASPSTLYFDNLHLGSAPLGSAPITTTDPVAYTPTITGFGTPTNVYFTSRRDGNYLDIYGTFTSGTSTATTATVTLGYNGTNSNVTIDTTKIVTGAVNQLVGYGSITANGTVALSTLIYNGATGIFYIGLQGSSSAAGGSQNGSSIAASGTVVSVFAKIPISGWSSGAQQAILPNQQVQPKIITYTSGSGTYTPSSSAVSTIYVRMIGGGGAGAGSGAGAGAGNAGTATTFGSSLLTANGGSGGTSGAVGGAGGTATIGSGASGTPVTGASGGGAGQTYSSGGYMAGGIGAASPFAGGGSSGPAAAAGGAAPANSGAGGGGAGTGSGSTYNGGGGGGAGGSLVAIINNPSAAGYAYTVGGGGAGGAAGTSGYVGGNAGSGYIEITEYSQNQNAPVLIGSVTSNSTGAERVERVQLSSTCTIASQSGSWVASASNPSSGNCTLTLTSGMFSAAPVCTATFFASTPNTTYTPSAWITSASTTSIGVSQGYTTGSTQSAAGGTINIICMGPR